MSWSDHTYKVGTVIAPTSAIAWGSVARYQLSAAVKAPGSSMAATNRRTSSVSEERPLASNMARSPAARAVLTQEGALGHAALGPEHLDVGRPLALVGVPSAGPSGDPSVVAARTATPAAERGREGAGMGHRHRGEGSDPLGVAGGGHPRHHGSPVVADEVEAVQLPLVGDGEDIAHELVDAVVVHRGGPGVG